MVQDNVQEKLNKLTNKFQNNKKMKEKVFLENIVNIMNDVGGISGIYVDSNKTMKLYNPKQIYNIPIKYEEHSKNLSSLGRRAYSFFEEFRDYLINVAQVSKKNVEYHLGRDYSSKHHEPNFAN